MNFANLDMVGHTGDFRATLQALEYIDASVHDIVQTARKFRMVFTYYI